MLKATAVPNTYHDAILQRQGQDIYIDSEAPLNMERAQKVCPDIVKRCPLGVVDSNFCNQCTSEHCQSKG